MEEKDIMEPTQTQDYTQNADSIKTLSERDKIRRKISVYAGDATINGFHVLLREPIDNAIDEFSYLKENEPESKFDTIKISIDTKTQIAKVRDYGRGIPYVKDESGFSTLEKALTILHAGGKHDNNSEYLLSENLDETKNKKNYNFSAGINGIGITLTTYASNLFYAVVYNEKKKEKAYMTFKDGYVDRNSTIVSLDTQLDFLDEEDNKDLRNGTLIIYKPSIKKNDFDETNVFEADLNFDKEMVIKQLRILPYLNQGLRIELNFDGEIIIFDKEKTFDSILNKENKGKLIFNDNKYFKEFMVLGFNRETEGKKVFSIDEFVKLSYAERKKYKIKTAIFELAFNFLEENVIPLQENTVNGSIRISGGKQESVWRSQIKKVINDYIESDKTIQKRIGALDDEDILSSLTYMFMVKINEPSFFGQTKEKLNNPELQQFGTYFFKKYLNYWINREDKKKMEILLKVLEANKKARLKSNEIKDNVFKVVTSGGDEQFLLNTTKLTKCKSKNAALCELFLVEGDSASGPCKESRVNEYQSVLPLKGKLINALKESNPAKLMKNEEIKSLITALECKIGSEYDYNKLRYHKIIIMSDKDIDGLHIRNLDSIFFYKYYPDLIRKGHIYIVDSPLYCISTTKKKYYAWSVQERDKITSELDTKFEITRFKGLGEMNSSQLYETCLDKEFRKLTQLTLEDCEELILTNVALIPSENLASLSPEEKEELIHIYMNDRPEDEKRRRALVAASYETPKKCIIELESPAS